MKETEDAVSPVVGVMLMLSVTVIIAAIVSAAAGGLSGTEKKAPLTILDVHFYQNKSYGSTHYSNAMVIEHISGQALPTRDLSIATVFRNQSGQLVKGSLIGQKKISVGTNSCGVLYINDPEKYGTPLQDSADGYASWFGNSSAILMAGDVMVTPAQYYGISDKNLALDTILNFDTENPDNGYKQGSVISTKIVHIPTGQILFDKDVVVV